MRRRNRYSHYSSYGGYNRRRKVQIQRMLIVLACILVVAGLVFALFFKRIKLMHKGYAWKEASIVLKMDDKNRDILLDEVKIDELVDWMEFTDDASYYDEYDHYHKIHKDLNHEEVVDIMNEYVDEIHDDLKKLGYKEENLWKLLETQSNNELYFLVTNEIKYKDIKDYIGYQYFKCSNVLKYDEAVAKYGNVEYAVNFVNFPFIISTYEDDSHYEIKNPNDISILVKKGFFFKGDYVPKDLVEVNIPKNPECKYPMLRKEAADALKEMADAAKNEGYYLVLNSGYRSYEEQVKVYKEYEGLYGGLYAKEYVATPGCSEHQSGLGVDLTSQSVVDKQKITFGDTIEYKWVMEHCYEYGFIERFNEGKADITGIAHEPWHLRYVGKKAAKVIHEKGWTYEEYCLYNSVLPEIDY